MEVQNRCSRTSTTFGIRFWEWDLKSDTIGYSPGLQADGFVCSLRESLSRVHQADRKALESARAKLVLGQEHEFAMDYRVQRDDESWVWVEERARAERAEDGTVIRLVCCEIDVTERKRRETELPRLGRGESEPVEQKVTARLLLAEDNASVARATMMFLEASGFDVLLATNGTTALEMAKANRPELILMDIQMPDLDGLSVIELIRSIPELKQTPIVALTGLGMPADEARCLNAGASHYVSKPYSLSKLVLEIQELIADSARRECVG